MSTTRRSLPFCIVLTTVSSAWALLGHAQTTQTWSSTPTSGNWSVAGNWASGTAPVANDSLGFGSTTIASSTNNLTAGTQINGITFNSGASTYTLSGNQITLGGSVTNNSSSTQTLSLPLSISATRTFNAATGALTLSGSISGAGGLTKSGTATLTLSGGAANTYSGLTTVSAGVLTLAKTAGLNAIAGDLTITGAAVTFTNNNQIADTAAVTMSGSSSVFNGTTYNSGGAGNLALNETINLLTVTGGIFLPGGSTASTGFVVTGSASFTGGSGSTTYVQNSGGLASYGSLALIGMNSTALASTSSPVANQFVLTGNNARQTTVTVGSGGLSLDGSNLLLQIGTSVGVTGSRLVLNGDVTTTGAAASSIRAPAGEANTVGTRAVELSGTVGFVTRTFTVGGSGADLTVSLPITNGSATTASLTKGGAGTLTLSASNSYTGNTTVNSGSLAISNSNALGVAGGNLSVAGGVLSLGDLNVIRSGTVSISSGTIQSGTVTNNTVAFNTQAGSISAALAGAVGLTKTTSGTLSLAGSSANTYSGLTTVSAGVLTLAKTAGLNAIAGDLTITGAAVTFTNNNQIADTAAVTMSGSSSVFNGTTYNSGGAGNLALNETINLLTVTGGIFLPGGSTASTGFVVTGSASFTGGSGSTTYVQNSGGLASYGSLALIGMNSTALASTSSPVANQFVLTGNNARQTTVTVGSGGLSLDGSNLLLQIGTSVGVTGSRLVLNGDVTTTGAAASSIRAPAGEANTVGTRAVELSGTVGFVTRTFTVGGSGADLTVSLPITNGSATTASLTKGGAGTLTLGAANTYSGVTTISAGALALGSAGSFANSPTIRIGDAGSSGAVLDLTAKTGTFAFTSGQTVGGVGTIKMDAGDTARFAGIIAPGNSPGILTFDGGTALLSGTTQIEIFGATRGTGYDAIDLINSAVIDYGNGLLALDFGAWLADQQSYQLFGNGSQSLLGDFSSVTIVGTNYTGLTFSGSNGVWTSQGTSTSGQTLTFTEATGTLVIVPEPGAIALAGIGIALAAYTLRRRT
jgi:fibronectin-binding autotransporter adhesin